MRSKIVYLIIILIACISSEILAKKFIDNIFIDRIEVFDTSQTDWFFAAPIANSIHFLTKEYLIEDELLFKMNDELNKDDLYETVRNLRATNLFTDVKVEIDSISEYFYDVYLTTQDRWTTFPIIIFGTGGNTTNIGGGLEEINLFGTGTHLRIDAFNRSENNIGTQGSISINQRRLFRTEMAITGIVSANKFRTDQYITINKPFRTLSTEFSYGFAALNSFGRDFLYEESRDYKLMPFYERRVQAWFSKSWLRNDRIFVTAFIEADEVDRGRNEYRRAFDNSGKFLLSFSSVAEDYFQTNKLNTYQDEDVPVGGWGTATIGKIFPMNSDGDNLYYIAAQGEKSYVYDNLYLFGRVSGASGFSMARGSYTYQDVLGKGFYRFNESALIASRIKQQSVWNWNTLRQLILDNETGLRGYSANKLIGDNRIIANTEFRFFPDIQLWIFNLAGVVFWDVGSVWRQNIHIAKTQWHHSAGFGIRFINMKGAGENSIFRLDFAFNFDEGKLGEIIFTTNQLFSVFQKHRYHLPELYGREFNYE